MIKTILITGTSSGIGRAIATYFSERNWNVAATMRKPDKETELQHLKNIKLYPLDVVDQNSIQTAINDIIKDFDKIDVVVNNAGYGAVGIFEKSEHKDIQKQFDVNVFGLMNVTRYILPHFRKNHNGTIINITSVGGRITFPLYSVYHGTKWAVEGFAEALQFELKPFNIKVKNVEPGAIKTDFYDRSQELFQNPEIADYDDYEKITFANTQKAGKDAPGPEIVAKTVYKAANSKSFKLRYPVGPSAGLFLMLRKLIPLSWFTKMVSSVVERGYDKQ
ncbi:SDR family oxidoreductase [Aquimarina sp. MMG016]|uniref:SDR family oxidoreductase n=1 Tax=Aquimarina sp. MMG016 TaxID=2822690 RepID=UPI001B3A487F|nr:SDR family oxidoreductase [Aquimarina sp. MMG016]